MSVALPQQPWGRVATGPARPSAVARASARARRHRSTPSSSATVRCSWPGPSQGFEGSCSVSVKPYSCWPRRLPRVRLDGRRAGGDIRKFNALKYFNPDFDM